MRIRIEGASPAADLLRGYLADTPPGSRGRFVVADRFVRYTVALHRGPALCLDSVDSPFEQRVEANLEELHDGRYEKQRAGSNRDPKTMAITVPDDCAERVARAVYRALLQLTGHGHKRKWYALFVLVLLAGALSLETPRTAHAQLGPGPTPIRRVAFASLGTPIDGTLVYCTDCAAASTPCTGSSTGSFAMRQGGQWVCPDGGGGGGGGAPTDAEYWTGAANATLSAEKNLGALSTGLVLNTGGVPSAYGGASCTNQALTALNASGAGTCSTITSAYTSGTFPATAHDILSATHGDTNTAAVSRGALIVGNSTPAWSSLGLCPFGQAPYSDGTDTVCKSISFIGGFVGPTFTTSSTSYVDVTGLTVPLPANLIFAFTCYGTFTTSDNAAGTTNGIGVSLNGTGGTGQAAQYTLAWQTTAMNTSGNNTSSTTPFAIRNENTFNSMTATASVVSVATSLVWRMEGFYYTGTSGTSTFAVRVRSENGSPQSASIQVGSNCLFTRQG